ncbi:uncharacterized protein F4812DRAFT_233757 [Daldinia caldariorum]|uniref:uncharacterized protein n=1 Tax=Daldinia caldariorum TaxID=326644 RepID=UPI002008CE56|nr:uncharacterized protein F4812DRAFT_233757 [Daldinia caldariorum]KAI1463836.1 hypothetical protein F4812DRAFT_233757 [Daldinia caldariorum]
MADESGFFTPKTARGPRAPVLNPGETVQGLAAAWLESYRNRLPSGHHWDWQPFFEALVEGNIAVNGVSVVFPPDDGDQIGGSPQEWRRRDARVAPVGKVPKPPGSGSWNYTWYIPEWSHPEFDPDFIVSYTKGFRTLGSRDPIARLFPALRPEDVIRQPTEWAKRFGIYPGELNGRSRLSPTLSATRDPWEDYANQLNLLSDEARHKLSQETQEAAAKAGKPAPPPGYIDRDALENLMNAEQRMTGAQLRAKMMSYLTNDHVPLNLQVQPPTTLEEFVDDLRANFPHILEAHRTYFQKALDDQDYQRIIFHDLTSDELVYNNIHTQSNDVECDLAGPLHYLLERHRWSDTSAKGAERFDPRLLYNINGIRAEWDMRTNDDLWNAMQPALQLLTRLLNSEHPGLHDLIDLRTRYKISPDITADRENPRTPTLVGYRPLSEMKLDLENSWPEMIELSNMGYDFLHHTWRVLSECLTFEISSAWFDPIEVDDNNAVDGVRETNVLTYGITQPSGRGSNARIQIWIAAELIWPLLVPQYSQSEKMTASFLIASTLMHEFAHAVNCAHYLLTTDPYWAYVPGQSGLVVNLLGQLGTVLWDVDESGGDPFWEGMGAAEVGFDLEKAVWGILTNSMVAGTFIQPSRQIAALPLLAESNPWPVARHPPPIGYDYIGPIEELEYPTENYTHPIPIDFMAQFFTQSFWTNIYPVWGPEALKLSSRDRLLKTSMEPTWINGSMGEQAYGQAEWWFISFVYRTLGKNNYNILAEYLKRRAWSIILPSIYALRWEYDSRHWDFHVIMSLHVNIKKLNDTVENAFEINRVLSLDHNGRFYEYIYRQNRNILGAVDTVTMDFYQWIALVDRDWDRYFSEGTLIMREVSATYRAVMKDISYLQRMVLDFLSLNFNARANIYTNNGGADQGPVGVIYRHIQEVNGWLSHFITTLNLLSNLSAGHDRVQYEWSSWETRYRSCHLACLDLLDMLGNPDQWQPDDMSWKRRFATIPSSYWKNRLDRMRVLAHRVYVQADPRVRHVFDECEIIMDRVQGTEGRPPSFNKIQHNMDSLKENINVTSLGHPQPVQDRVYNWTAPRPVREPVLPKGYGFTPQPSPSTADVVTKIPDLGLPPTTKETIKDVFGVPRDPKVIGTRAPRRLNLTSLDTSGGPSRDGGSLGATSGGIQKNRRPSHKGFGHWNKDRDGAKFLFSAQKMNSLDALQEAAAQTSASQNTTPLGSFGTGGAFMNKGDTVFVGKDIGERAGNLPTIFPSPFANSLITTADAINYDYQRGIQDAQRLQEPKDRLFETTQPFREARATGFEDDHRSDTSTPPNYPPPPPGP